MSLVVALFERKCGDIVLGVELVHASLPVALNHVDVDVVALVIPLGHSEVHNDSRLDSVNQSQPLEWDEPRRIIRSDAAHTIINVTPPVDTQPGPLCHNEHFVIVNTCLLKLDHLSSYELKWNEA